MAITGALVLVVVWVLVALIPMRAPSARRIWAVLVLCTSILVIAGAAFYGMQHADEWAAPEVSYGGPVTQRSLQDDGDNGRLVSFVSRQWEPAFFAATAVGPGALVALLPLALSRQERSPYIPPPPAYPPAA